MLSCGFEDYYNQYLYSVISQITATLKYKNLGIVHSMKTRQLCIQKINV